MTYLNDRNGNPINPNHVEEWRESAIQDSLIELNLLSFAATASGYEAFRELLLAPDQDGFLTKAQKEALASGGWGFEMREIDGSLSGFGVAKPNKPRESFDKKKNKTTIIKYDIACGVEMIPYLPVVSAEAWKLVCDRYNYEYPEDFSSETFWEWLGCTDVPVIICEGLKKALALLSQGYAAIALNGVYGGYSTKRDDTGKVTSRQLVYEIEYYADGRQFFICFDQDEKPKTRRNVNNAGWQLAQLIDEEQQKHKKTAPKTKTILLPPTEAKGVDDFLAAYGIDLFEPLVKNAKTPSKQFFVEDRTIKGYPTVNAPTEIRYLNDCWDGGLSGIPGFEKAKIVALHADKSVGKSYAMSRFVEQEGLPVINISHRRSLGRETSSKFSIVYGKETPGWAVRLPGLGLCVDSLRKNCKVAFDISKYTPGEFIIIIDEIEQFLKHLLQSTTDVGKHRQQILRNFQWLLANAKKIVVADADMTLIAITILKALAKAEAKDILVVRHDRKAAEGRNCYVYDSEAALVTEIEKAIEDKKRIFIFTDAKSGKFGTVNLEKIWRKKFSNLGLIRFDQLTLEDIESDAFKAMGKIHEACKTYQVVLGSPSIATGVSFDVEDIESEDFDAVFGFFTGTLDVPDGLQALSRVRNGCDRHVFIAEECKNIDYKISKYATTESLVSTLIETKTQDSLEFSSFDEELDEWFGYTCGLKAYSQQIARENRRKWNYKTENLMQLRHEGYEIIPVNVKCDVIAIETKHSIAEDETKKENREAISTAKKLDKDEYLELRSKQQKTPAEKASCERYFIDEFYGEEPDNNGNTSEFVVSLHENKFGEQITNLLALRSYLKDTEYLQKREDSIVDYWITKTEEVSKIDLFAPDLARKSKVAGLNVLKRVGFFDLLEKFYESNQTFNKNTPEVIAFWEQYQQLDKKDMLLAGYKASEKTSAMQCIRKLLERFLLALGEPSGANSNRQYRITFNKKPKLLAEYGINEADYNSLVDRVINYRENKYADTDSKNNRIEIELQYLIAELSIGLLDDSTIDIKEQEVLDELESPFPNPSDRINKQIEEFIQTGANFCEIAKHKPYDQVVEETADIPF